MGSSPTRGSSFFLRKVTALVGCAVLLCLVVCLTLLASFFLPSHLSLKHVRNYTCIQYMSQNSLWGLVLAELRPAQWVILFLSSSRKDHEVTLLL